MDLQSRNVPNFREKTNVATANPYLFDTFKLNEGNNDSTLTTCRLENGNGCFFQRQNMIVKVKLKCFQN